MGGGAGLREGRRELREEDRPLLITQGLQPLNCRVKKWEKIAVKSLGTSAGLLENRSSGKIIATYPKVPECRAFWVRIVHWDS